MDISGFASFEYSNKQYEHMKDVVESLKLEYEQLDYEQVQFE